jgi:uncharacterized repeat protein (TIGR01451 family)
VTNQSDVPARDAVVMLDARGAQGQPEPRPVGVIGPHQSRTVEVAMRGTGDRIELTAAARARCAAEATARTVTALREASSLRVGTVDTVDPIQVGETTTYEVTVTNQGRTAADDVDVVAHVPAGMTVIDVDGPTRPVMRGDRMSFGPVTIPGGQTATWRVHVRADRPGPMQWRTEVDSPLLERPVPDVEPTRVLEPAPQ